MKVERGASLTFDAYSAQWLRERALKPRTQEGYEHLLGAYLRPGTCVPCQDRTALTGARDIRGENVRSSRREPPPTT